jgi:hypothetical protein
MGASGLGLDKKQSSRGKGFEVQGRLILDPAHGILGCEFQERNAVHLG